jgi:FtsH-binding integral membrane protein
MSVAEGPAYLGSFPVAADAPAVERSAFIQKTYVHLAAAIGVFVFLEAILLHLPGVETLVAALTQPPGGFLVFGAFLLVSWVADRWARSSVSVAQQYLGLGVYVLMESLLFLPLLWLASNFGGKEVIPTAAFMTLILFCGLSAVVFVTRKDFSFLRVGLGIAGLAAFGFIVVGMIFGFSLGTGFTVAMIALAAGYVLYDTSNVLHHYRVGQHVAASLSLFASIALMFYYILRLVMDRR